MASFAQWLRVNAQRYLLEAAQRDLAARYRGDAAAPVGPSGPLAVFWRHVFVPAYRLLPWPVRHRVIRAMPGSHRRHWTWRTPPPRPR